MREIKFRVWDKEEKRMLCPAWLHRAAISWEHGCSILIGNYLPMQFTGLTDKAGREIYEGDIVRYSRTKERGRKELGDLIWDGPIQWNKAMCGFTFHYDFPTGGGVTSSLEWEDYRFEDVSVEVVGNIHETPDLLKAPS